MLTPVRLAVSDRTCWITPSYHPKQRMIKHLDAWCHLNCSLNAVVKLATVANLSKHMKENVYLRRKLTFQKGKRCHNGQISESLVCLTEPKTECWSLIYALDEVSNAFRTWRTLFYLPFLTLKLFRKNYSVPLKQHPCKALWILDSGFLYF